jgi:ribosomal protein L35
MTKTNKAFLKRLRVTKGGKVLSRTPGHCHFKAKEKRRRQLSAKRPQVFDINKKTLGKYLP